MDDQIIILDNIYKFYQNLEVLKGISFNIEKGQIFGYLGPNGSGKTTTIKIILGLIKPSKGEIKILGKDPYPDKQTTLTRQNIGFMLEHDGLYDTLTGFQNLVFWAKLYNLDSQTAIERSKTVMNQLKLNEWGNIKVKKYSFGMRKRLEFARALLHKPEILVLDEPTVGADPESRYIIRNLMKNFALKGKTIFFSSHDLEEIQKTCSHVAVIKKGEILFSGALYDLNDKIDAKKIFIKSKFVDDAETIFNRLTNEGYAVNIEGPLISFHSEKSFDIEKFIDDIKVEYWEVQPSLEELYLTITSDEEEL